MCETASEKKTAPIERPFCPYCETYLEDCFIVGEFVWCCKCESNPVLSEQLRRRELEEKEKENG